MTQNDLERAAIAGHADGVGWIEFHRHFAAPIVAAEPDVDARVKLEARLLHLLVTGEASGQYGCNDDDAPGQWEVDDLADTPSDTITRARFPDQATMFDTTAEYR